MKTQILPNWFKKVGLVLFIIASLLNGSFNFIDNSKENTNGFLGLLNAFSGGGLVYFIDFVAIAAVLIFMISREKVEDDYINKLRLEAFQFTTILGLLASIVIYTLAKDIELTLDYFIFPIMWCYLAIFFIKRKLCI